MEELKVEGQTLLYEVLGEGEPLLFVNNIAVDSSQMRTLAQPLNQAGYQLVLYNHRGPGDNQVEQIATRTGQLLDHLDLRAFVIGLSMGAFIAQELALQRPDRVRAAVLTATVARRSAFLNLYQEAYETLLDSGIPESPMMALQLLAWYPPNVLSDDTAVERALAITKSMSGSWDSEQLARALTAQKAYDNRLDALKSVTVPSLVVAFELDVSTGARQGREVADAIPGCEYVEIPGAAHVDGVINHMPEVLSAALDFFSKVKSGTP